MVDMGTGSGIGRSNRAGDERWGQWRKYGEEQIKLRTIRGNIYTLTIVEVS